MNDGGVAEPDPLGSPAAVPEVSQQFACALTAPGEARRFATDVLTSWHRPDLIAPAELVVSELATNAVVHAQTAFVLTMAHLGPAVRLAITDHSTVLPEVRHPDMTTPHGRGMQLVAAMTDRWGTEPNGDGKTVWAVLSG